MNRIFSDYSLSFLNPIASLANMLSNLTVADLHLSHMFLTTMTITLVFLAQNTKDFSPEQLILLHHVDINKQSYICTQHCIEWLGISHVHDPAFNSVSRLLDKMFTEC